MPVDIIQGYHGVRKTTDTIEDFCSERIEITMYGYYGSTKLGVDISNHVNFSLCPCTNHVIHACKYCNHWGTCYDQSVMEIHLLTDCDSVRSQLSLFLFY
jgi:hypothetical protein